MNTLLAKLSLTLVAIIAMIGAGFAIVNQISTRLYYEELTQRLNAPIAMYVSNEQPLIRSGGVNGEALERLAHHAMVVNPSVEIYLLSTTGEILGHVLAPDAVKLDRVDVEPIRRLLAGDANLPLRGTDPRSVDERKIFSVAEVRNAGVLQGYLYVILGGRQYEAIADTIRGSYTRRSTLLAIAALLVIGLTTGVITFALLTRRLRRLTADVRDFGVSEFAPHLIHPDEPDHRDELGGLESAFRSMAARISEQLQRLRESDRLRRELVSNVSHDLRTPLASMQGYVETLLIKNGALSPDERRDYLLIARKHTQRLNQLIEALFELSKLESGDNDPEFERFSLAELLHDTAQEFDLVASEKNIDIQIDAPTSGTDVYADIGLIQRVFENLVRNALQFTPAGGQVRIAVENLTDRVGVAVIDTGCGIPKEDLPQIFNRFYRHESGNQKSDSSGLGLAIVKRILDLHGSRINVSSELDHGTRIEFDLPSKARAA